MQSYQRIQCIGHTDFNTSGPNGPHSLLRMKGGTTRLCQQDRTQRLTRRNRGLPSLGHSAALCCQRNPFYSTVLLYTYISRFSVAPHYQQREKIRQSCRHKFYLPTAFHCVFQLLSQTIHVRFRTRKRVHTRLSEKNRTQRLARRNRGASLRSCAEYLVAASSLKEQPEKVDARQWRASASSGVAAPQGCGTFSLVTA